MKILAGVERPTSGKIFLDGCEIHIHSPLDATRLGIGIIYQELNLCANLSVTDNIYLAREICQQGFIDKKLQKKNAQELVKRGLETSVWNLMIKRPGSWRNYSAAAHCAQAGES